MEGYKIKNPLKILMTTDTVGGIWTYSMELCKALQRYNTLVFLVTTGARMQNWQQKEVARLDNVEIFETDYQLEWMENPWDDIKESGEWLLKLEEELVPDVIHLNCYAYGALAWKAPVLVVAHSDAYSWWSSVKNDDPGADWNEYFWNVKEGMCQADMIVAPSQTMLNYIQDIYCPDVAKKVIYNARNPKLFYAGEKEKFSMSMGRIWDEAKNIKLLVQAANYTNHPIRIAGENTHGKMYQDGAHSSITYMGPLDAQEVTVQLAAAAIYALPAKYEPFGLSVLEAALSGCALVLGNIDSLKEIWEHNAVFVDTNDPVALAEMLNYLMKNDAVRQRYAKKANQHAQQFTTHFMAQQYMQVYQELVQQQQSIFKKEIA